MGYPLGKPNPAPWIKELGRGTQLTKPSTQIWIKTSNSAHPQVNSRAMPRQVALDRLDGPDTGSNSG